jgi:hypothetical protein
MFRKIKINWRDEVILNVTFVKLFSDNGSNLDGAAILA